VLLVLRFWQSLMPRRSPNTVLVLVLLLGLVDAHMLLRLNLLRRNPRLRHP
jgi:hypothetical protein